MKLYYCPRNDALIIVERSRGINYFVVSENILNTLISKLAVEEHFPWAVLIDDNFDWEEEKV